MVAKFKYFILLLAFLLLSSCSEIEKSKQIYKNDILSNLEYTFRENNEEMKSNIIGKVNSSAVYTFSVSTKDFENLRDVKIIIESTGDIHNERIPTFSSIPTNNRFIKKIKLEENSEYNMDIEYFAIHRIDNNDWNGNVSIKLVYIEDGIKMYEDIGIITMKEPCVPNEFEIFYEAQRLWDIESIGITSIDETGYMKIEPYTSNLSTKYTGRNNYKLTKVIHSYKSSIDGEYYSGYVTYVLENLTYINMGPEIYDVQFGFKVFYPNAKKYSADSEDLALKSWRSGYSIFEEAVSSSEYRSSMYKIKVKGKEIAHFTNSDILLDVYAVGEDENSKIVVFMEGYFIFDYDISKYRHPPEHFIKSTEEPLYNFDYIKPTLYTPYLDKVIPREDITIINDLIVKKKYKKLSIIN